MRQVVWHGSRAVPLPRSTYESWRPGLPAGIWNIDLYAPSLPICLAVINACSLGHEPPVRMVGKWGSVGVAEHSKEDRAISSQRVALHIHAEN